MEKRKKVKLSILAFAVLIILPFIAPLHVDTKNYILTPEEYTITGVTTYETVSNHYHSRRYQINITHEKDGKVYKSHCYTFVDKDEYNIIKSYFDSGNQEAAKNYIGNIKAYHSSDFKILNEEIND